MCSESTSMLQAVCWPAHLAFETLCCLLALHCQLVPAIRLILERMLSQLYLMGPAPAGRLQHSTLCLCQLPTGLPQDVLQPPLHAESCLPCAVDHLCGDACQLSHLQATAHMVHA